MVDIVKGWFALTYHKNEKDQFNFYFCFVLTMHDNIMSDIWWNIKKALQTNIFLDIVVLEENAFIWRSFLNKHTTNDKRIGFSFEHPHGVDRVGIVGIEFTGSLFNSKLFPSQTPTNNPYSLTGYINSFVFKSS